MIYMHEFIYYVGFVVAMRIGYLWGKESKPSLTESSKLKEK